MDSEIIYSIIGILILIFIIIVVFYSNSNKKINSKAMKKDDIINKYKRELHKILLPLKDDKKARMAKKNELLARISNELSRNIFFDNDEIKETILMLANE